MRFNMGHPFHDAIQKLPGLSALQVAEGPASAPKYRVSPTPMPVRCEEWGVGEQPGACYTFVSSKKTLVETRREKLKMKKMHAGGGLDYPEDLRASPEGPTEAFSDTCICFGFLCIF